MEERTKLKLQLAREFATFLYCVVTLFFEVAMLFTLIGCGIFAFRAFDRGNIQLATFLTVVAGFSGLYGMAVGRDEHK